MFQHLFKLIWKRKARNLMLSLELLLAFVVVFAVAAVGVRSTQLYQQPLGFDGADVWSVRIEDVQDGKATFSPEVYDSFKRALEALPEVRKVAFASTAPYTSRTMVIDLTPVDGGPGVKTELVEATDDFLPLLGVTLVQGRSFDQTDNGAAAQAVVVNGHMARAMFGDASPIGKTFDASRLTDGKQIVMRVVGVVDTLRMKGEFDSRENVVIMRHVAHQTMDGMRMIMLKTAPGTTRSFEEKLSRQLKLINNGWAYEIAPLAEMRKTELREQLIPLKILAVVAAFLLVMVAFGLFGVLWQNTARRIPEIGLRRAIGASSGNIYRQIIAEQMLLSSMAMAVALLILVQLPLTGTFGESLNWTVFGVATALSMAVIYLLSLLCSVYPGWRASRMSPTAALHYE